MVKVWSCNVLPCACCCLLVFVNLVLLGLLLFCVIKITPQASPCVIKRQVVQDCGAFFLSELTPSMCQGGSAFSSWVCFLVRAVVGQWHKSVVSWSVLCPP